MIALIAVLTFLLLARAFRSLLLPLKAVILNVISVGAAWGVITLIWQDGHGSSQLWGIPATHSVTAWIPLMVFAFLFGLSMDYEVFILARMREEYDATGSTDAAVVRGIGRTGRLVTSAALILFLAFVSMASGPETDVKVFATGLAAGIMLDATVIRALLVPAVVSLFGRWNWWLPERPARLLRVEPSLPRRVVPEPSGHVAAPHLLRARRPQSPLSVRLHGDPAAWCTRPLMPPPSTRNVDGGDEARLVAGQEQGGVGDLLGSAKRPIGTCTSRRAACSGSLA